MLLSSYLNWSFYLFLNQFFFREDTFYRLFDKLIAVVKLLVFCYDFSWLFCGFRKNIFICVSSISFFFFFNDRTFVFYMIFFFIFYLIILCFDYLFNFFIIDILIIIIIVFSNFFVFIIFRFIACWASVTGAIIKLLIVKYGYNIKN